MYSYHTKTQSLWRKLNSLHVLALFWRSHDLEWEITELLTSSWVSITVMIMCAVKSSWKSFHHLYLRYTIFWIMKIVNILQELLLSLVLMQVHSKSLQMLRMRSLVQYVLICGDFGHIINWCYKIHGYPSGLKPWGKVYPPKKTSSQHVHASTNAISSELSDKNKSSSKIVNTSMSSSLIPEQLQNFIAYFSA